jgi:hypothetical protein
VSGFESYDLLLKSKDGFVAAVLRILLGTRLIKAVDNIKA